MHALFFRSRILSLSPFQLEEATAGGGTALLRTALRLHNLADLHRRVEELCGAAVEADGLALVELALAVVGGDALLLARLLKTVFRGGRKPC